ncbi:MAG TPA: NUDIX domain-containing protein [Allosphingosinicella sp.]|jgi:8-oxo-dGTP diphosphatase
MTTSRSEPAESKLIRIVAAVILNSAGETLLVRKRGTAAFMQPGGKPAEGESEIGALEREIVEELGCALQPDSCRPLGRFRAAAANEPGWTVCADLFSAALSGEIRAAAEIEEAIWVDPDRDSGIELAPLTRAHALPLARALKAHSEGRPE